MKKSQNSSIRIAVIGAGYMGQNHARILSSMSGVVLNAICDIDKSKTNKLSKQYKIKSYYNFNNLYANEQIDAVSICLPTSLHFSAAKLAIDRKIAVFIEKPICSTQSEARALIRKANLNKVSIMVGHIERFNPVVNEIKQRIKSGEIGKILKIHTQRFSPPTGRAQDVSAITDLATHDIDIVQYILDDKPIRIYSETQNSYHKREDLMSAVIRFKKGTIGIIEVSWLHPSKIRQLTVLGENGMYVADYLTQELFFYRQNENLFRNNIYPTTTFTRADVVKIAFQSREPLQIELDLFIRALQSHAKMPVTGEDGLVALEMTQKMMISGRKHQILK